MTDQEINIAIAEAAGWTDVKHRRIWDGSTGKVTEGLMGKYGDTVFVVPSYTTDLNAIHEVEKTFSAEEWYSYDSLIPLRDPQKIHATARQRAEAFLRVKGVWK